MGYVIFRGSNVLAMPNVLVSQMPSHKKAAMRNTEYYIKGRDGALHVDEGLENYDVTVRLVLMNAPVTSRYLVNAWADGTGKLISSDDLNKAWMATVKDEIVWTRVQANDGFYDTAEITFNCQPYMYEAEDSVEEFTASGQLVNPGSATAYPLIKVEGSGDVQFTVAGRTVQISNMSSSVPVFLDCANGYVYTSSGLASTMTGSFPILQYGTNSIVLGSNVTKLTITPHWRWI